MWEERRTKSVFEQRFGHSVDLLSLFVCWNINTARFEVCARLSEIRRWKGARCAYSRQIWVLNVCQRGSRGLGASIHPKIRHCRSHSRGWNGDGNSGRRHFLWCFRVQSRLDAGCQGEQASLSSLSSVKKLSGESIWQCVLQGLYNTHRGGVDKFVR